MGLLERFYQEVFEILAFQLVDPFHDLQRMMSGVPLPVPYLLSLRCKAHHYVKSELLCTGLYAFNAPFFLHSLNIITAVFKSLPYAFIFVLADCSAEAIQDITTLHFFQVQLIHSPVHQFLLPLKESKVDYIQHSTSQNCAISRLSHHLMVEYTTMNTKDLSKQIIINPFGTKFI